MRLIILIHKYQKYQIKFLLIQISIKLQFILCFHCFSTILTISTTNYNYYPQLNYQKQLDKFSIIQISIKHNLYQNAIISQQSQ